MGLQAIYPKRNAREPIFVRKVGLSGKINWHGRPGRDIEMADVALGEALADRLRQREVFVTKVLMEERVGLEEIEDGIWQVCFGPVVLGRYDEREKRLS